MKRLTTPRTLHGVLAVALLASAGGAVAGGRIDGALLPVAYVEPPPVLTADDLKRAAADREKRLRERAARLPGRAASAPKKE